MLNLTISENSMQRLNRYWRTEMPIPSKIIIVTFKISYIIQNYLVYYILKVLWYYNKPSKPKQNHQMRRSEDPIKWKFFKVIALDSLYLANMICAFVSQNLNIEKIFLMYELLRIPEQGHKIQNMHIPYYLFKGSFSTLRVLLNVHSYNISII